MRVFVNYVVHGKRSSIQLPEKLVLIFNEKYPGKSIGSFITTLLKNEKAARIGSSFVLSKLIENLL